MVEVCAAQRQLDQWDSIKKDYICIEEKIEVSRGLYEQYLSQNTKDYNIQNENKQYIFNFFDEYKDLKKQIEEAIYSPQTDEEIICVKINEMNLQEIEHYNRQLAESEQELKELEDKYEKIKKHKDNQKKLLDEEHRSKKLAIQNENVMNKYKMFAKVDISQTQLINSLIQSNDNNQSTSILLNKYYIHELLTGIQISERLPFENRDMFEQLNVEKPWYDIQFTNLQDDCLDFDANLENYPAQIKHNLMQLSNSLVEFYKSIFRKRKNSKCVLSQKINNCVFMNNLDDFKLLYSSYLPLICMSLTEQEITSAMKQFAIEWVKGSRVVNVLINSSSSKMGTIVLPQFYPLTGTNQIKLIKLTGHEDKEIKSFSIAENCGSLSEWISVFTDMYNSNSIA